MRINVHAVMRVLHHTLRVERDRVEAEAPVVFEVLAPCLRVDDDRRGFYGNLGKNALYRRDESVTLRRLRDVAARSPSSHVQVQRLAYPNHKALLIQD